MSPHSSRLGAKPKVAGTESDLIRAILVDDERLMRQHLRRHLSHHPEIEIVGEAVSVSAAWELISEVHPEVVFLDVQMAPQDGFALLPLLDTPDGKHRSALVWTVGEKDAAGWTGLSDRAFTAEVQSRVSDIFGQVELCAPRMSYPLKPSRIFIVDY